MKIVKYILFLLSPFAMLGLPFCAAAQSDTTCLETARLARIADTIAYLRKFEQYIVLSDSALAICKDYGSTLREENEELKLQRGECMNAARLLDIQLAKQKELSGKAEAKAIELDVKLQKQRKAQRIAGGAMGGGMVGLAGALVTVIIILKK